MMIGGFYGSDIRLVFISTLLRYGCIFVAASG